MSGLFVSFLYLCLHVAIIIFVACFIVWICKWFKIEIDANVYKVGQVIVALLIIIAVVAWLLGVSPSLGWRYG